jgi:periplasmic protein TonB
MESNKILNADLLDILFEGKNKEYGAYELRKTYNGRMMRALTIMGGVVVLLFTASFVSGRGPKKAPGFVDTTTIVLSEVHKPDPPVIVPPKPRIEMPQVATIRVTPPRIVPDDQVRKEDMPPENDKMDDVKIGTMNKDGAPDGDIVGPPAVGSGSNVVEAPKKDPADATFIPIEKESEFPGGAAAWLRYLNHNMVYPSAAQDIEQEGVVVVKFMVDANGNVSDVEAIAGPEQGGLREEAVRVIRKSGKWTPALQNGRYVRSYKQQPVTFKMVRE